MNITRVQPGGDLTACLTQLGYQKNPQTELYEPKGTKRFAPAKALLQDRLRLTNPKIFNSDPKNHREKGAWVSEAFVEVEGNIYGVRGDFNLSIPLADEAVNAHRTGEFYLGGKQLNGEPYSQLVLRIANEDSTKPLEKRRVACFRVPETEMKVSTKDLGDCNIVAWLAQSKRIAQRYGKEILKDQFGWNIVNVYNQKVEGQNKLRAAWVCRLGGSGQSAFKCYDGGLDGLGGSAFGVDVGNAEGVSQRNLETQKVRISNPSLEEGRTYATHQIAKFRQIIADVQNGKSGHNELNKILQVLG